MRVERAVSAPDTRRTPRCGDLLPDMDGGPRPPPLLARGLRRHPAEVRHWTRAGRARRSRTSCTARRGGASAARPAPDGQRPADRPAQRVRPRRPVVAGPDGALELAAAGEAHALLARPLRHARPGHAAHAAPEPHARRQCGMGSFRRLLRQVTRDPAMQLFLSLADSHKDSPNENYARELMELFTLGRGYDRARHPRGRPRADRLARHAPRRAGQRHLVRHASATTTASSASSATAAASARNEVLDIVVEQPRHAPFLVSSSGTSSSPSRSTRRTKRALARTYRRSGLRVLPVVEEILRHTARCTRTSTRPTWSRARSCYLAGALRGARKPMHDGRLHVAARAAWARSPFRPPSVAGWDWGTAWLTSGTIKARLDVANNIIGWGDDAPLHVPDEAGRPDLAPREQVERALDALGAPVDLRHDPPLAHERRRALLRRPHRALAAGRGEGRARGDAAAHPAQPHALRPGRPPALMPRDPFKRLRRVPQHTPPVLNPR